ncbi:MAG: menaquinone biosynthesis protein [Gorillibacterium sp.]|nr:menaquinone biosynthesis protein [Gorillibacterium sp.]
MSIGELRIGRINFTNVWPIYHHFPVNQFTGRIKMVTQVPSSLNEAMAAGQIDMGPISSFAYGQHFDEYVLFPELSVSALGKVNSILLFHKKPLEQIKDGKIMLPTTSASSANLLRILFHDQFGGEPQYRYDRPNLSFMRDDEDAVLLIGDDAIRAYWTNPELQVTDLGEWWHRLTGKWMSFAVWAIRKQALEQHGELISEVFKAFKDSKLQGLAEPSPMISHAVQTIGGTTEFWRSYFDDLCFDFGPKQWAGLQFYYDRAFELRLLDRPVHIDIWQDIPSYR